MHVSIFAARDVGDEIIRTLPKLDFTNAQLLDLHYPATTDAEQEMIDRIYRAVETSLDDHQDALFFEAIRSAKNTITLRRKHNLDT